MRLTAVLCLLSILALTACDPAGSVGSASDVSPTSVSAVDCNADPYQYLVSSPIELAQEVVYPGIVRVLGPEEFLTKDFDPSRLTITTGVNREGDNVVGRVFCG